MRITGNHSTAHCVLGSDVRATRELAPLLVPTGPLLSFDSSEEPIR
jgi:hypothetical protein